MQAGAGAIALPPQPTHSYLCPMKTIYLCLATCLSLLLLPGCAEDGLRKDLFGDWHETMVLFRDYQNNVLVAADSTTQDLFGWRFKRDGNGRRTQGDTVEKFKWTLDEGSRELNLCTDQGLLSCVIYTLSSTDADHIVLITRYNATSANYTEGEYRLTRGKTP